MLAYVRKAETRISASEFEGGVAPSEAKKSGVGKRTRAMVEEIIAGETSEKKLLLEYKETYLKVYKGVSHAISLVAPEPEPEPDPRLAQPRTINTIVYYGNSGTGKTSRAKHAAFSLRQSLFRKNGATKEWWDGYKGETAVLLDDFRGWTMPFSTFLQMTDPHRSPVYKVQVKGKVIDLKVKLHFVLTLEGDDLLRYEPEASDRLVEVHPEGLQRLGSTEKKNHLLWNLRVLGPYGPELQCGYWPDRHDGSRTAGAGDSTIGTDPLISWFNE